MSVAQQAAAVRRETLEASWPLGEATTAAAPLSAVASVHAALGPPHHYEAHNDSAAARGTDRLRAAQGCQPGSWSGVDAALFMRKGRDVTPVHAPIQSALHCASSPSAPVAASDGGGRRPSHSGEAQRFSQRTHFSVQEPSPRQPPSGQGLEPGPIASNLVRDATGDGAKQQPARKRRKVRPPQQYFAGPATGSQLRYDLEQQQQMESFVETGGAVQKRRQTHGAQKYAGNGHGVSQAQEWGENIFADATSAMAQRHAAKHVTQPLHASAQRSGSGAAGSSKFRSLKGLSWSAHSQQHQSLPGRSKPDGPGTPGSFSRDWQSVIARPPTTPSRQSTRKRQPPLAFVPGPASSDRSAVEKVRGQQPTCHCVFFYIRTSTAHLQHTYSTSTSAYLHLQHICICTSTSAYLQLHISCTPCIVLP